jgi:lipoprotein-releasing system ATP-binding protein
MSEPVLLARDVRKTYGKGDMRVEVLRGVNLSVLAGEMVALLGPSGSGKSTLLHILGLLDHADTGEVLIGGEKVQQDDNRRTRLRCRSIGFVYQFHHLLPEFSALENVIIPQMTAGASYHIASRRAEDLLSRVGLAARVKHRPSELSGGEQQRVAIARALANKPKVLIADEPTGNLDAKNSDMVFNMLGDICRQENTAILMATHNLDLAARIPRMIEMKDGIVNETRL